MNNFSFRVKSAFVTTVTETEDVFERLSADLIGRTAFCVTDETVFSLYGEKIKGLFGERITVIGSGEDSKTERTLFALISTFGSAELTKNSVIVAFGGGVVGDVAGLACALYKRGITLFFVPTTLLSQVDSAFGGKTAVNVGSVKNVVGCFYPARKVYLDRSFLDSLSRAEILSGAGEIVKYALLDKKIYKKFLSLNDCSVSSLSSCILGCAKLKSKFVKRDFYDTGVRRALNAGHTTAHALELLSGKPHGICVAFGLYVETAMAKKEGETDEKFCALVLDLIKKVCDISEFSALSEQTEILVRNALSDKKNTENGISFVAPVSIGKWETLTIPKEKYAEYLKEILTGCAK